MRIKSVVHACLVLSLMSPYSFADVRVGSDLSPEQAEMVARAKENHPRLAFRVLTKTVRGQARSVVIVGEPETTLPADTMIAKKVIDQFEHFAVGAEGPYLDRETPQEAPNALAPMNLPPLGARVKTIQNAEANFKGTEAVFGALLGLGYFAMTGYFSGRFFVDGFRVQAASAPVALYNTIMLGISAVGGLAMLGLLGSASEAGQREKAVAEFVDGWIRDPQYDRPVVLIVKKEQVAEIERILVDRHDFETDPNVAVDPA